MAMYVSLIQFTEQGIRNIKDTLKRSEAAMAEARKNGHEDCRGILDDGRVRRGGAAPRAQ
jgi:uncharacterized protein with GYD domain